MTHNKRFEAHFDQLNDARIEQPRERPCTLPLQAYGPQPIVWTKPGARPSFWAWITWADRPAERIAVVATGWNDRVVVEWNGPTGTLNTVVWRNAVTLRREG